MCQAKLFNLVVVARVGGAPELAGREGEGRDGGVLDGLHVAIRIADIGLVAVARVDTSGIGGATSSNFRIYSRLGGWQGNARV